MYSNQKGKNTSKHIIIFICLLKYYKTRNLYVFILYAFFNYLELYFYINLEYYIIARHDFIKKKDLIVS